MISFFIRIANSIRVSYHLRKSQIFLETIMKKKVEINYAILLPVFLLCILGLLSLYVALKLDKKSISYIQNALIKQAIWLFLGLTIALICSFLSPKFLWKFAPYVYVACVIILILLLKYYDQNLFVQTGAKNWFNFGGITFQPTEIVKIGFILILAKIATQRAEYSTIKQDMLFLFKMFLVFLPIAILLLLQNDFGTLLVFISIFIFIFFLSGASWKIIVPGFIIGLALGLVTLYLVTTDSGRKLLMFVGFKEYQFNRIDIWLNPFLDVNGASYQISRALVAIGTGGLAGKGFGVSDIYVPVRESDMIFSVIGENFGFIGGAFLIGCYFILIYQIFKVCLECNNIFFVYIGSGVVAMIFFHIFENIGANIGVLPLTGIPLPFISQGGSSIISNFIGVGLTLSMSRFRDKNNLVQRGRRRIIN